MEPKELWELTERKVVIRARAGLYDHIELGVRGRTDICVMTQTEWRCWRYLVVVSYTKPAHLNRKADHCGFAVDVWQNSDSLLQQVGTMIEEWPELWQKNSRVVYDWIPGAGDSPVLLNPRMSVGLLRHLARIESWLQVRSEYPEGQDVWDSWHGSDHTQHLRQVQSRLTGYIGEQLRAWTELGKTMADFLIYQGDAVGALPDICCRV